MRFKTAWRLLGSLLFVIFIGTFLLSLPISAKNEPIKVVDAFFTASSAVCVTGLVTKDLSKDFSLFGQIVILFLIQIGGLGIMTFAASVGLFLGQSYSLKQKVLLKEILEAQSLAELKKVLKFIILFTFIIESIGAGFLFLNWIPYFGISLKNLYYSVFHSISAFCNAGFSLFPDSLVRFRDNLATNLIFSFLIILGGLGFFVNRDLFFFKTRFKLHTKIVLLMSLILLVSGSLIFYLLEFNNSLSKLPVKEKILASWFQSVTARTAGFNTLSIKNLKIPTQIFLMFLMFIGACPGSTGGGIKTTTLFVIFKSIIDFIKGRRNSFILGREIPLENFKRAVSVFCFGLFSIFIFTIFISIEENFAFDKILFEVTSAFATCGLSTGITPFLKDMSKILLSVLMIIGKLGPVTFAYLLRSEPKEEKFSFPQEGVMVG